MAMFAEKKVKSKLMETNIYLDVAKFTAKNTNKAKTMYCCLLKCQQKDCFDNTEPTLYVCQSSAYLSLYTLRKQFEEVVGVFLLSLKPRRGCATWNNE